MNKVLDFLRLIDAHDGKLSLTNLALIVVLVKIGVAPEVSLVDAGALFVTLLSYQGKKVINKAQVIDSDTLKAAASQASSAISMTGDLIKKVDELTSKVTQQQMSLGIKDIRR